MGSDRPNFGPIKNAGMTTADPHALDADAILVGQAQGASTPGHVVIVTTGNVRHLGHFAGIGARPCTVIS
jgi:hypothetical protein